MSYIVSEVYEAFMAAADLQRAPKGVRFIAMVTVVLLASLYTAAVEGQDRAQQPSVEAGGESPGTANRQIEARLAEKAKPDAGAAEGEFPTPGRAAGSRYPPAG